MQDAVERKTIVTDIDFDAGDETEGFTLVIRENLASEENIMFFLYSGDDERDLSQLLKFYKKRKSQVITQRKMAMILMKLWRQSQRDMRLFCKTLTENFCISIKAVNKKYYKRVGNDAEVYQKMPEDFFSERHWLNEYESN